MIYRRFRYLSLFLWVLTIFCNKEKFNAVGRSHVYCIQKHNDSLYFSTSDSGIFRFSPQNPNAIAHVARAGNLPIRSMVFAKEGLYAASYYAGVHYLSKDSLLPLIHFPWPAWSIKLGPDGNLWLAGLHGIFRQQSDSLVLFNRRGEVHDLAFYGNELAVAQRNGIFIFNRETGELKREFLKDAVCWTITTYDSLFIGGGLNVCGIINKDVCATISFGPKGNMVWSTALDKNGALYLGTQKGLYRAERGIATARCVGFKNICIKSLAFDDNGRLWVGRFAANLR